MLDLIIRNGTIIDGTGEPGYAGDLGVRDGRIVSIGEITETAPTIIDASNRVVAPGFIDPHTHFDAQLLWDGRAQPAIEHGVTTVVPGNCSLSLAPLKAEHRQKLVGMFNQIEEMPPAAFEDGVEWDWETFPEYLDRLRKDLSINVAPLVGHSMLRLWVMGDAAMARVANASEIEAMQQLLRECLDAGAVGLSTSFVDSDEKLQPVPSRYADQGELDSLAAVLGEFGRMLQIVPEFYDTDLNIARIDQLAELSLAHNIPTTFSPLFFNRGDDDGVARVMQRVDEHFARGARVWPQVQTRPIDISFCFAVPSLLFIGLPTWYPILRFGSHDDIKAAFRDPDRRAALVAEAQVARRNAWAQLIVRQVQSDANQALIGRRVGDIAEERGTTPVDVLIDLSLEEDLQAHFLMADMGHNDADKVGALLAHPRVHVGASDGGAHILSFATYGDTGYLFSQFVRANASLSLPEAVKKITADPAQIWGLPDRGVLKTGNVADITIFDAETIDRGAEYYVQDVPGNGSRYVRDGVGIDTVVIGGEVAYRAATGYTESALGRILPG